MKLYLLWAAVFVATTAVAKEPGKEKEKKDKKAETYVFQDVKTVPVTSVKDQSRSGTCWSFSGMGEVESDLLVRGKGEHDLAEMWIVRNAYFEKAVRYVRMHGSANLGGGGTLNDVVYIIDRYGIVPEEVYPGLRYGTDRHVHGELDAVIKAYVDAVVENPNKSLSTAWQDGLNGMLDAYLGPRPEKFAYRGKEYTPKSFAEELGIPSESGLAMLVGQARFSSELFQGHAIEDELLEKIEDELRSLTRNVVLIGMPGAGKTSCGKRLARMLGRPFVDIDEAILADTGRSAAQIIQEDGEDAFRRVETEVTASYCKRSGMVIACGGGVVTRPQNRDLLRQNGRVVLVDRPLDELSDKGRPVSQAKGVERLAAERMHLYHEWADVILRCTGSAQSDAELVKELLRL